MDIVVASNNKGKIREIKQIFAQHNIISMSDAGIFIDIEETGETFLDNALIKAKTIFDKLKCPVLSDDSGLIVDALDGQPGVHSARYSGKTENADFFNNALLLKNLEGKQSRVAKFVSVVVLYYGCGNMGEVGASSKETVSGKKRDSFGNVVGEVGAEYAWALGEACGEILFEGRGSEGFGYDPLFFSHELNKTFAEASLEEKNQVSHRAKALKALAQRIDGLIL